MIPEQKQGAIDKNALIEKLVKQHLEIVGYALELHNARVIASAEQPDPGRAIPESVCEYTSVFLAGLSKIVNPNQISP